MYLSRLLFAALTAAAMGAEALAADPSSVTVPMSAQKNSNETGTATLTQRGKDLQVVIDLSNAPAAAQPAHVHPGTCAKLAPAPKYPLSPVVNGKSNTLLKNVTLSDLTAAQFAINVHKSANDLATYVSCGDLSSAVAPPAAAPATSPAPTSS